MKNILIFGATSDMAIASAHRFAKEGFDVHLTARNAEALASLSSDLEIRTGVKVKQSQFEAQDFDSHLSFVQKLDPLPDVVLWAIGYMPEEELVFTNWEEASKMISINFTAAVSVLNPLANLMMKRGSGTIIGISSVAGERGRASKLLYGSAKAGLSTYLDALRNHLFDHGVHVVTVKPGFVNTKMTEDLDLPGPLTAEASQVGDAIYKAFAKSKNTLFVLWMWKWVMMIIRNIPEFVFKKLKI